MLFRSLRLNKVNFVASKSCKYSRFKPKTSNAFALDVYLRIKKSDVIKRLLYLLCIEILAAWWIKLLCLHGLLH